MQESFTLFPPAAALAASEVDHLYFFEVAVSLVMTVLIFAAVFIFAIKYRRRSEADRPVRIVGSIPLEIVWTAIPFAITMIIFVWGASLYFKIETTAARAPFHVSRAFFASSFDPARSGSPAASRIACLTSSSGISTQSPVVPL